MRRPSEQARSYAILLWLRCVAALSQWISSESSTRRQLSFSLQSQPPAQKITNHGKQGAHSTGWSPRAHRTEATPQAAPEAKTPWGYTRRNARANIGHTKPRPQGAPWISIGTLAASRRQHLGSK